MMRLLPNIITLGRVFAVPVTVYCILTGNLEAAFWLFVAAGVSDAADGAIARLFDARTVLGSVLDPLADKALLVSVYLSLAKTGGVPLWLAILVVFRDALLIGGVLLTYTLRQAVTVHPLYVSKINTLAQILLAAAALAAGAGLVRDPQAAGVSLITALGWLVAATTVLSGALYIARSELLFGKDGAQPR